jgi:hypothetical protein
MGFWIRDPALLPQEEVVWRRYANREQGSLRQVGGRLLVTSQRIVFVPNRFDDATGGDGWSSALANIARVEVEPSRRAVPFLGRAAQLRRRLRIETIDGQAELFVVNRVAEAAQTLRAAAGLGRAAGGSG